MIPIPTIEEANLKSNQNPLSIDPSITDLEDFCSSFLDFDSIKDWVEQESPMDDVAYSNTNSGKADSFEKLGDLGTLIQENVAVLEKNDLVENLGFFGAGIEKDMEKIKREELGSGLGCDKGLSADVADLNPNLETPDSVEKFGYLGAKIEEAMGKVKLEEFTDGFVRGGDLGTDVDISNANLEKADSVSFGDLGADVEGVKSEKVESGGSYSDSDSEKESESDSSSRSEEEEDDDDVDDDVEEVKDKVDVEDGEINDSDVEKMVGWSEDEFGDEDGGGFKGPVKSRNEIKDLPHVPPVEVSLQPRHHTVPVGVISSIIDAQVIVEGVEQHNPLNEGTIFWITESRSPLGLVDEIFGPVKSPYYIIRYNSENEVPEGIKQGTPISFVPEFANHVLKDDLYKKGYDASGENDEEISDDYEFSDDEQEAEFRKLQKIKKKRGTNEANCGNEFNERKNFKNRGGGSSRPNQFLGNSGGSVQNNIFPKNTGGFVQNNAPQGGATQVATNQNQQYGTPVSTPSNNDSCPNQFIVGQNYGNLPSFIPPFHQMVQAPGFIPPPNVVWMNAMPGQQGMVFPNGMMWPQQNLLPNGVPFPQQFVPNQNFSPNAILTGTQPNFSGAPSFESWPGPFAQNGPNQQFGVAMPMNMNGQQLPPNQGNTEMPREFNPGAYRGGGHAPHHRGGGRFRDGRGQRQAK